MLILAGLLAWFTPAQRIFYGVLAALVSVYSLIGVNFGGFFIGMLLGIVGGSLIAAWTPVRLESPPAADAADQTDDGDQPSGSGDARDAEADDPSSEATVDQLLTGPLTDVLPTSTSSPIPHPRPSGWPVDQADDAADTGGDGAGGAADGRRPASARSATVRHHAPAGGPHRRRRQRAARAGARTRRQPGCPVPS